MPKHPPRHRAKHLPNPASRSTASSLAPSSPTPLPPGFQPPPASLKPHLSSLFPSRTQLYLTHTDTHAPEHKRTLFLVPLVTNALILSFLIYRVYYIAPTYAAILTGHSQASNTAPTYGSGVTGSSRDGPLVTPPPLTAAGTGGMHGSAGGMHGGAQGSAGGGIGGGIPWSVLLARTRLILMDFGFFYYLGGWPWAFFIGSADGGSMLEWWLEAGGGRKRGWGGGTVVVRGSRGGWAGGLLERVKILAGEMEKEEEGRREGEKGRKGRKGGRERAEEGKEEEETKEGGIGDDEDWNRWVKTAIEPGVLREKSALRLEDKRWGLAFRSMVVAQGLLEKGTPEEREEVGRVGAWVYVEKWGGWVVWRGDDAAAGGTKGGKEGEEEKRRRKIVAFKDTLTAMGKESLFFAYVDLLSSASSATSSASGETEKAVLLLQAKRMFERDGVDWDGFLARLPGGRDGLPGLEV